MNEDPQKGGGVGVAHLTRKEARNLLLYKKGKKEEEKGHFRQGHFGFGLVRVHHSLHLRSPALVQPWQVDNHH